MTRRKTRVLEDFAQSPKVVLPRYDELRSELRKWFRSQDRWKSFSEMARDIGINEKTLGHYFTGYRFPTGERRAKLYKLTKLECLRADAVPKQSEAYEMAEKTRDILFRLAEQLEYFKHGENRRSIFRSIVPPGDVGYITSFLKALYDEENFLIWNAVNNLKKRGDSRGT